MVGFHGHRTIDKSNGMTFQALQRKFFDSYHGNVVTKINVVLAELVKS